MPEVAARIPPAADAAHSDHSLKTYDSIQNQDPDQSPMKPYNSKSRIVLDVCIQIVFYTLIGAAFWIFSFLIP
jgi:hypothetical protein